MAVCIVIINVTVTCHVCQVQTYLDGNYIIITQEGKNLSEKWDVCGCHDMSNKNIMPKKGRVMCVVDTIQLSMPMNTCVQMKI